MAADEEIIDIETLELNKGQEVYEFISGVFPDADPAYLRALSVLYSLNQSDLGSLIDNLLKTKDYPKKLVPKIENADSTSGETTSHRSSLEAFVEKFNDPIKYFTERNVGQHFIQYSKQYLQTKFLYMGVRLINDVLIKNNLNLTLSSHALQSLKPNRSSKRSKHEIRSLSPCLDERFNDEVYFLDNKEEIIELISNKAELLKLNLEEARLNNDLIECQCCFNDEVFRNNIITCIEGHLFCKDCVKRSVEIAFGEGKIKFDCLCECESHFLVESLQGLIAETLYRKIQLKIQESEIKSADISGICFCPFCEYAEIPPDDERIFKCKMCKQESCRFCQEKNHIPLSCKEHEDEKLKTSARAKIETKMTEALLRECYKCKKKFIKLDGCNKMQCICGALMCYICRQPVRDYSHFNEKIQAGIISDQPSTSKPNEKCPLWSNNSQLHLDAVVEAAKVATAEVESEHPGLRIETKQLLKGLKRKMKD